MLIYFFYKYIRSFSGSELLQNLVKKEDTENGVVKKKSKKSPKKLDGHVEDKSPSEIDDRLEKKTRRTKRRSIEKLPVIDIIDIEENKSLQKINGSLLVCMCVYRFIYITKMNF